MARGEDQPGAVRGGPGHPAGGRCTWGLDPLLGEAGLVTRVMGMAGRSLLQDALSFQAGYSLHGTHGLGQRRSKAVLPRDLSRGSWLGLSPA